MANDQIIVKKYKKGHHGAHGGAWKIAYADFVTAMMAFFLLMWLISISNEETKKGIAEYFTASILETKASSIGSTLTEGKTALTKNGNQEEDSTEEDKENTSYTSISEVEKEKQIDKSELKPDSLASSQIADSQASTKVTLIAEPDKDAKIDKQAKSHETIPDEKIVKLKNTDSNTQLKDPKELKELNMQEKAAAADQEKNIKEKKASEEDSKEKEKFEKIIKNIQDALNSLKEMDLFKHNLVIELTNEGIKIQIIDSEEHEMFKSGSAAPLKFTEKIIKALGDVIAKIPNKIDITGHTDSKPFNKKGYGNWELSSDRAHTTRRILESCNIKNERFAQVNGRADRDPFNKKNLDAPENRRISITILYN